MARRLQLLSLRLLLLRRRAPVTKSTYVFIYISITNTYNMTYGTSQIDVGADGNFVFNPANVTASNGTLVTFFFPG